MTDTSGVVTEAARPAAAQNETSGTLHGKQRGKFVVDFGAWLGRDPNWRAIEADHDLLRTHRDPFRWDNSLRAHSSMDDPPSSPSHSSGHAFRGVAAFTKAKPSTALARASAPLASGLVSPLLRKDIIGGVFRELLSVTVPTNLSQTGWWMACTHRHDDPTAIPRGFFDEASEYSMLHVGAQNAMWRSYAEKYNGIVSELEQSDLGIAADRLRYLREVTEDDHDEVPIQLASLRHLSRFLNAERHMATSRIGVGPDGLVQMDWRTSDRGIVAMKFLPDGKIQFAGLAGPVRRGQVRKRIGGTLHKAEAMTALQPFLSGIASQ